MAHSGMTISRGFDAGNYACAYETEDYSEAIANLSMNRSREYVAAFTLGFFSSHEAEEMGEHFDTYLEALALVGERAAALGINVPTEQDYDDHNQCEAAW
jgi:hypothetical protein